VTRCDVLSGHERRTWTAQPVRQGPRLRCRARSGRGATAGGHRRRPAHAQRADRRTEAAYTATTRGDLVPITADLPAVSGSPAAPTPSTAGADREWVVAVMGDSKRQGRWRVERPLAALAVMGDVVLDLRGAEVPQGNVDITATAVMGDVKIYVPDGVDVQLSGIAVMGDKKVEVREAPAGQTAPKVVVRATVIMGDVKVLGDSYAEPARRTLRAWLTRDDRDRRAIE
jgi:Cell wall-active antibiotics response 4TMS YvqF/Domain of unknown function (DUF1707)